MARAATAFVAAVLAAAVGANVGASEQAPTFGHRDDLVAIDVVVRRGHSPVTGLAPADFQIADGGVPQRVVQVFADTPLDVTLVVEGSDSAASSVPINLRRISGSLGPDDRLGILGYGERVRELRPTAPGDLRRLTPPPPRTAISRGRSLFDGLAVALMRSRPLDRRQLIVSLVREADSASVLASARVQEVAQRARRTLYVVATDTTPRATRDELSALAQITGGRLQTAADDMEVNAAAARAIDEFRHGYVVLFRPSGVPAPGWHDLTVTVPSRRDATIQVRTGYFAAATTPPVQGKAPADLHRRIADHVKTHDAAFVALRRDLHRRPDVSGQEARTAGIVAARLKEYGLTVRTGVGGHGVVGVLNGGRPGPLVAYRADMDAVRSNLADPAAFPSEVPGVRHICGHDVHVAVGVGLASALASVRRDLAGRVMFIFQPDEERAAGAKAMLDAGLFDGADGQPAAIFGLHAAPIEVGTVMSRAGLMMHPNAIAAGVTNDAALYAAAVRDLTAVMGAAAFSELPNPPPGFSEDFGEYQKRIPGVFFFLGLSNASRNITAMPHSAAFDVDEAGIAVGIRAMAAVVVGRLSR